MSLNDNLTTPFVFNDSSSLVRVGNVRNEFATVSRYVTEGTSLPRIEPKDTPLILVLIMVDGNRTVWPWPSTIPF